MRRLIILGLMGLGFVAVSPSAHAQAGFSPGFSDPFFLYYGFYLPRQAALAAQPTTTTQLNDVAAARQSMQMQDRQGGLYGPIQSPFDPNSPDGQFQTGGKQRLPKPQPHFAAPRNQNNRNVPHFNELASRYPTARVGNGPNKNMAVRRPVGGGMGMGGMGMPSVPSYGR